MDFLSKLALPHASKKTLILYFLIIGFTATLIRWFVGDSAIVYNEDTVWKLSIAARFDTVADKTFVSSFKPKTGEYTKLISQQLYHPDFQMLKSKPPKVGGIRGRATRTRTNSELLAEYYVQLSHSPIQLFSKIQTSKFKLLPQKREQYLSSDLIINLTLPSLVQLNERLKAQAYDKPNVLHLIFLHSQQLVHDSRTRFDSLENVIKHNRATILGRARLMVSLCRLNGIPARIITGFVLSEAPSAMPYYWV